MCQSYFDPTIEDYEKIADVIVFADGKEAFEYLRDNAALPGGNYAVGTNFDALVKKLKPNSPQGTYSLAIQICLEDQSVRELTVKGITGRENCAHHNRLTGISPPLEHTFAFSEIDLREGDIVRWRFRGRQYGVNYGEILYKCHLQYDTVSQRMHSVENQ